MKKLLLLLSLLIATNAQAKDLFNRGIIPLIDASAGFYGDAEPVHKFGFNPAMANGVEEDLWDGSGSYVYLTTADQLEVFSGSADDDESPATGAWTIKIYCLNAAWEKVDETIALSGTSIITTTMSCLRVYRAQIVTAGSGGTNAGQITIRSQDADTVQALVLPGRGQSLMCLYTIPANQEGYLLDFYAGVERAQAASVDIAIYTREAGTANAAWRVRKIKPVVSTGATTFKMFNTMPEPLTAKTDIRMTGTSSTAAATVSCGFDILLHEMN